MHIMHHENTDMEKVECAIDTIHKHLQWDQKFLNEILSASKENKHIIIDDNGIIKITNVGKKFAGTNYYELVKKI